MRFFTRSSAKGEEKTSLHADGEPKSPWSVRSQRAELRLARLEEKVEQCKAFVSQSEKTVGELKLRKDYQLEHTFEPGGGGGALLPHAFSSLRDEETRLATYRELLGKFTSEIEALKNPSAEQAEDRLRQQSILGKLVVDRLEKDREAERAVETLLRILHERSEMTDAMVQVAAEIDFTIEEDGLDERRFKVLLDSLPTDLAAASEKWVSWFLGSRQAAKEYRVHDKVISVAETLASANVFCVGEVVNLTQAEADSLLSKPRIGGPPVTPAEAESAPVSA
jgi:hypothetical protein